MRCCWGCHFHSQFKFIALQIGYENTGTIFFVVPVFLSIYLYTHFIDWMWKQYNTKKVSVFFFFFCLVFLFFVPFLSLVWFIISFFGVCRRFNAFSIICLSLIMRKDTHVVFFFFLTFSFCRLIYMGWLHCKGTFHGT